MNNLADLQFLPMMEFFCNTLLRLFSIGFLLKYISDFTADKFFVRKKHLEKNGTKNILRSTNKIWKLKLRNNIFKNLRHFLSSYNKKYNAARTISSFFLVVKKAEARAFGNNIERKPQKQTQNWKNSYVIYLQSIFTLPAIQFKWSFGK